jgi:3'(2'), 5'-bisphosphate nucleotidase
MIVSAKQLDQLFTLMIDASENTLRYHGRSTLEVVLKDDQSPLTEADRTTNEIICSRLRDLFPEVPIISEENRNADYATRRHYEWVWLIDPLDGTKEFVKAGDDYTVNVGLVHCGQPVMGLVTQPVERQLYFGWSGSSGLAVESSFGHQACRFRYRPTDVDSLLRAASVEPLRCIPPQVGKPLKIVASKSHLNRATEAFLERHRPHELVNIGSSLKIIQVADSGRADLYPRLGPTSEWDTAAAHAVLVGSGGQLKRLTVRDDGGYAVSDFVYNKEDLLNPLFVAGHPELLSRLFPET